MTIIVKENETVYLENLEREIKIQKGYKEENDYILRALEINKMYVGIKDLPKGFMGIIDEDYSLIRYLCEHFFVNDIRLNHYGYVVLKRKNGELTTLQRVILEYYANFDEWDFGFFVDRCEGIKQCGFEINHINGNKLDNRIQNLEVVTRKGNQWHRVGRRYECFVVVDSSEIQRVQQKMKNTKQYEKDRKYLQRISKKFQKCIEQGQVNEDIVKCSYLELKYSKKNVKENCGRCSDTSDEDIYRIYKLLTKKDKDYIKDLIKKHNEVIVKTVIDKNIKLLERFQKRYKYLNEVLTKYKLNDLSSPKDLSVWEADKSKRILLDFFKTIQDFRKYRIKDSNILCTLDLRAFIEVRGKYKAFLVAYLLGLLVRQKPLKRKLLYTGKYVHTPSFVHIPVYTEDLLKKANEIAKKLLELNLNKITYFTVSQAFGTETADRVFQNEILKSSYNYTLNVKQDMLEFLKNEKCIYANGYLVAEDILRYFQELNLIREIDHQPYNRIYSKFLTFISSLLNYNEFIRSYMEELRF